MQQFDLIATSTFGLEAVVARELEQLGYDNLQVRDGRVVFRGTAEDIVRCNLWLRTADRVLIRMGEFPAADFGQLFDGTNALPWHEMIPVDAQFPVKGRSVRSQLHAVPRCQAIVKKAIVENLKQRYLRHRFAESGTLYSIEVSLLEDVATLTIDTSGPGLHKRGYREIVGRAPLRETMAAGLIQLSYWNRDRQLVDPFCGSGTIPIEAAMIGRNIAPGMNRTFAAEDWTWIDRAIWKDHRATARAARRPALSAPIHAYDHDPEAIRLAQRGAREAGVAEEIEFREQEISRFSLQRDYGCVITNPPYGERLGERPEVEAVYRELGRVLLPLDTWSIYVLTSHTRFEEHFGRKAVRRRKLYNGRIACQYYQYPGPPPPRPAAHSEEAASTQPQPDSPESPASVDDARE